MRLTPTSSLLLLGLAGACVRGAAPPVVPAHAKRAEGSRGMVVASHPDAAAAGLAMLRQGGNAVDAAVATAFALGVVDPSQTGLGGGGGMTLWRARPREAAYLDFYPRTGRDPRWAGTRDSAASRVPGQAAPAIQAANAGIPGTVAGLLDAHARWGSLPIATVMAPAIALARDGFVVSPLLARTIVSARAKLAADSLAAARFLPAGEPLRPGDRLVQPEQAATLQQIAAGGRDAFYTGPLADAAVAKLRAMGSLITREDWAGFRPTPKRPLCAGWRGYTILSAPPPLNGRQVLEALNLLDAADAGRLGSPTEHGDAALAMAAALRVSDADAERWRGDPAVFAVPARGMASAAFARERQPLMATSPAEAIPAGDPWDEDRLAPDPGCAALDPWGPDPRGAGSAPARRGARNGGDDDAGSFTSHFSVVDGEGNAVGVTFTVGVLFGSGVYVNGYFLSSAAANFDDVTRGPDRIASSTMSPTVVLRDGRVRLVVGAAGSAYIPTAVVQVAHRVLALGEDPWAAVAAPRLHPGTGRVVEVEPGMAAEVYAALARTGYLPLSRVADITFGGVHAIGVGPRGRLVGAADPRRDGAALGW